MQRTAVNPWEWSIPMGFDQAEVIEGPARQVICSGQTAVDGEGNPQHPGDMRAQMELALDNLEAVLQAAGMGLGDVIKLGVYVTDTQAALENFDVMRARFGELEVRPAMTLLGVTALALPGLMFEIEATAAR